MMPTARLNDTDRGSQYTADDYLALLRSHGIHVSMSGNGGGRAASGGLD